MFEVLHCLFFSKKRLQTRHLTDKKTEDLICNQSKSISSKALQCLKYYTAFFFPKRDYKLDILLTKKQKISFATSPIRSVLNVQWPV